MRRVNSQIVNQSNNDDKLKKAIYQILQDEPCTISDDEEDIEDIYMNKRSKDTDDIIVTSVDYNFIDPLTKTEILDPIKNILCNHIYEKTSILQYIKLAAKSKRKVRCPNVGCVITKFNKTHLVVDEEIFKFREKLKENKISKEKETPENIIVNLDGQEINSDGVIEPTETNQCEITSLKNITDKLIKDMDTMQKKMKHMENELEMIKTQGCGLAICDGNNIGTSKTQNQDICDKNNTKRGKKNDDSNIVENVKMILADDDNGEDTEEEIDDNCVSLVMDNNDDGDTEEEIDVNLFLVIENNEVIDVDENNGNISGKELNKENDSDSKCIEIEDDIADEEHNEYTDNEQSLENIDVIDIEEDLDKELDDMDKELNDMDTELNLGNDSDSNHITRSGKRLPNHTDRRLRKRTKRM